VSEEKVFNHTAHVALWDWLSNNPDKQKCHWPGWKSNDGDHDCVIEDCFACDYDPICPTGYFTEDGCPLIWPQKSSCWNGSTLYHRYLEAKLILTKKKIAAQIRDLPIREGVKTR